MESFSCNILSKSAIKSMKLLGIVPMRKAQNTLFTIGLVLSSVFAMNAQSNDNSDAKLLADNSLTDTELVDKKALDPVVRQGKYTDAQDLSRDEKIIVIDVSGGKGTKENPVQYTAQQWAIMLQGAFGDKEFTNYPTKNVVANYRETGEEGPTVARVIINGYDYKTKDGTKVFTPEGIAQYIDVFTKKYADEAKLLAAKENQQTNTVGFVFENN